MSRTFTFLGFILLYISSSAQLDTCFTANTGNWFTQNGYQSNIAQNLGVHMAGQDGGVFAWRSIQPNLLAPFNWTRTDSCVRALQSNNIDLFATIRCVNPQSSATDNCSVNYTSSQGYSWLPVDTTKWLIFIDSLIERYDHDGFHDMAGLLRPVNHWRIETEYNYYWCSNYTGLLEAQEFSGFVNLTYTEIKNQQPTSIISYAGIDTRHDLSVFYDGYTGETSMCKSTDCATPLPPITHAGLSANAIFLANDSGLRYLLNNTSCDELDIHQYGRWQFIPDVIRWIRDSTTYSGPIDFLEGGGPFCTLCEFHNSLPNLYRENSSYVVYYYITSLASHVSRISWHISPEYQSFSGTFGDMDLQDSVITTGGYLKRPALYTYRFLADSIFKLNSADSVMKIPEANQNLFHYRILPMNLDVVWSINNLDSLTLNGTGNLNQWIIPTTCPSYPIVCDSMVQHTITSINGNYTIHVVNGIPVFYSWGNVLSSVNETTIQPPRVEIFPNPVFDNIQIQINYPGKHFFVIYDLEGREVMNSNFSGTSTNLNTEFMPAGIYSVKVTNEDGSSSFTRITKLK